MTTYNLSDLFEIVADARPETEAVVSPRRRLRFVELDLRANRLAHFLESAGVGPGDHVGLQLLNGTEYLEGMLAAFKLRAVPINVNYRYVEGELRYLFDNADLAALVLHRQFAPRVAAVAPELPRLRSYLLVEDGTEADASLPGAVDYEAALEICSPERGFPARSSDDHYIAYTGGTTGRPKGVVWRHEDIFYAALGGGDPMRLSTPIERPDELVERIPPNRMVHLPAPPLMHVSGHWAALQTLYAGGKVVLASPGPFDPDEVWRLVGSEQVNVLIIVGDAMARPLADALATRRDDYDVSSLFVVGSGGAVLSSASKERLAELLPGVLVVDAFGSSETGAVPSETTSGPAQSRGPRLKVGEDTAVLDDDLRPVSPGSGVVGHLARRGHIPLGYYNDPDKTEATFVKVSGVRWALSGDMATVDDEGAIVLLGRGSVCINTGGEKVYPEEVEFAVKSHPDVTDAVIVGVPDARWGERVVAVVSQRPSVELGLADVQMACRTRVAAYKVPRELVIVAEVVRLPSGKTDYRWAREQARKALLGLQAAAESRD